MRHDVHIPALLPDRIRCFHPTGHGNAGVGTEQIDRADIAFGLLNHPHYISLLGHIRAHGNRADLGSDLSRPGCVQVHHHDRPRALGRKAPTQGFTDATRSAGDDDDFLFEFHPQPPQPN